MQNLAFAKSIVRNSNYADKKYSLAIIPFEAEGQISDSEVIALTDRFRAELEQTRLFEILSWEQLQRALENSNIDATTCSMVKCAVEAGRAAQTKLSAAGIVKKLRSGYFIEMKIIHVKSEKVVETVSDNFEGSFIELVEHISTVTQRLVGASQAETSPNKVESVVMNEPQENLEPFDEFYAG